MHCVARFRIPLQFRGFFTRDRTTLRLGATRSVHVLRRFLRRFADGLVIVGISNLPVVLFSYQGTVSEPGSGDVGGVFLRQFRGAAGSQVLKQLYAERWSRFWLRRRF